MSVDENILIAMLKGFKPEYRSLLLQKYVQRYGALSQEAGVKEILDEVEE